MDIVMMVIVGGGDAAALCPWVDHPFGPFPCGASAMRLENLS